jgi:uncharacterized protein YneF (UPF0154 family)
MIGIIILLIGIVIGAGFIIYGIYLARKRQKEIDKWKKKYKTY